MDNNRFVSFLLFLAVLGIGGVMFWGLQQGPPQESTSIEPGSLLLFTQAGCPPCRELESVLHSNKVSEFMKERGVKITEINTRRNQNLVHEFQVQATPTLIMIDKQGKETARSEGAMGAQTFMDWVRTYR
jgi:thioredoxin-related protein